MRKYVFFLKCSSIVVKVMAWILLLLGLSGAIAIFSGSVPNNPFWMGFVVLGFYISLFFLVYLIAKIADILVKVINAIEK